jgi:hypothetical protein
VPLLIAMVNHRHGKIAAKRKSGKAGSGRFKMTPMTT